jgi:hypothetical protein
MARGEEREISIFNMSFLDVFCCTVGALIFILFIQILRTRDMVERQELQKIQASLAEAKKELDSTKEEITDAEKQLGKIRGELKVARAESEKKDTIIENLKKRLQTPQSPSSNREFADLPNQASSSTTQESRWAMEAQKTARGQFLLGNLETRPIVCSGKGLYFGMSREAVSVGNNLDIKPLFREFLRFYDARQEGLWRTIWGDGVNAYNLSIQLQLSESAYIGKGLVTQKELLMQQAQQIAASKGTATVDMDTDHDGKAETRFEDSDGDGTHSLRRYTLIMMQKFSNGICYWLTQMATISMTISIKILNPWILITKSDTFFQIFKPVMRCYVMKIQTMMESGTPSMRIQT